MYNQIIESITRYYGIDWLGSGLSLLAIYLIGNKKRSGFFYGTASSMLLITFGILAGSFATILFSIGFLISYFIGYLKWKPIAKQNSDE